MKNVAIILLSIAVIGLGGYIGYIETKENKSENNTEKQNVVSTDNENSMQVVDTYETYLENLSSNLKNSKYLKTIDMAIYDNNSEDTTRTITLSNDGYVYVGNDEFYENIEENGNIKEGTKKLNLDDVVDLLYFNKGIGQSDITPLFALDIDGNVYYIASSLDWDDSKINPIKINELKNIVAIENYDACNSDGCFSDGKFIDINGNKYSVMDILEKYNLETGI
ncbi:MAG: hypothetical protein J6A17_00025 [Bacilli bacterium]|nr:hypothetical protein [Bacilli bacterium]